MERDIKYKLFDKRDWRMIEIVGFVYENLSHLRFWYKDTIKEILVNESIGKSDAQLLQFTEMIGKNKTEIWEDDIVKYWSYTKYLKGRATTIDQQDKEEYYEVGRMRYSDGCWWLYNNGFRNNVAWLFTPGANPYKPSLRASDLEVIGNYYLNREFQKLEMSL